MTPTERYIAAGDATITSNGEQRQSWARVSASDGTISATFDRNLATRYRSRIKAFQAGRYICPNPSVVMVRSRPAWRTIKDHPGTMNGYEWRVTSNGILAHVQERSPESNRFRTRVTMNLADFQSSFDSSPLADTMSILRKMCSGR